MVFPWKQLLTEIPQENRVCPQPSLKEQKDRKIGFKECCRQTRVKLNSIFHASVDLTAILHSRAEYKAALDALFAVLAINTPAVERRHIRSVSG